MFENINNDIRLLHANSQNRLDVVYSDDKKKFRLVKMGVFAWIFSLFTRTERFSRLQDYAKRAQEIFENQGWQFKNEQIDALFFGGLSKWDFTLFDRSTLSKDLRKLLSKNLGHPFVDDPSCSFKEETDIENARKEIELALKLGIPLKKNKGCQGSFICLDYRRKPIGIFKKEHHSKSLYPTFRRTICTFWGLIKNQTLITRHEKVHAEVAASIADKTFSMKGFVPLTRLVTLNGVRGSLQLWSHGMIEAAGFNCNRKPDEEELHLFQIMVMYDFLLGNLDRHLENWLLRLSEMKKLEKIAMIDNGSILPEIHPSDNPFDCFARKYMYQWKNHPWAGYPFSRKILKRMRELSENKIDEYISDLQQALPNRGKEFLSEMRIHNLRQRATLLFSLGRSYSTSLAPSDLGQAYSTSKLQAFIQSLKHSPYAHREA